VDDDTYVQTDAFFTALVMMPREHLMLGFIPSDPGGPSREDDNPSPWSVSWEEWPREKYAMWADGGCGYVLTRVRFKLPIAASMVNNKSPFVRNTKRLSQ
jgi:hypothetical protein